MEHFKWHGLNHKHSYVLDQESCSRRIQRERNRDKNGENTGMEGAFI